MKVFNEDGAYDDEKFPSTSECKRRFKTTEEGVSRMCEITEKYWNEGREKGRMDMLMELVRKNILSIKDAAEQAGMTEAAVKKMAML